MRMRDNEPMGNPYAPKPPGTSGPPAEQERRPVGPPPAGWGPEQPAGRARRSPREREPVDPEAVRGVSRRLVTFALLLLACLLLSSAPLPWRMTSVALSVAALVAGGMTLRYVWRAKVRGLLVAAVVAGMAVSATLGLATLAVIPVWDIETARQECLAQAITHSARSECLTDYKKAMQEYQDSLTR